MLNRKSFILFTEWYDAICELSDKEQAELFRNLFVYHMDNESEIKLSTLAVKLVWKLIHPHLSRNADKYDARSISSRENGKKGGRPKNLTKPNTKPNKPIETLYVNDNVNDNVNKKSKKVNISPETFYKKELTENTNHEIYNEYKMFVNFLFGNNDTTEKLTSILKLEKQVTFKQYLKLYALRKENKKSISDILLKIENDVKYTKGKKSLNLTLQNWLKNKF